MDTERRQEEIEFQGTGSSLENAGEKSRPPLIRFGTSSFSSKDWVGSFYPPGTRPRDYLPIYARQFDTVEIDATYYAVPTEQTVKGWARKTPDHFLISAKFPKDIVHGGTGRIPDPRKVLDPDFSYPVRDEFLEVMKHLGPRLGPLVIQFPFFNEGIFGSPEEFFDRLDRFLDDLPGEDFSYAVEIRNPRWVSPVFADLCRKHRVTMVLVDQARMQHADELEKRFEPVTTPDLCYIRLLGDREVIEQITTTWEKEVLDRGDRLSRWAAFLLRMLEREVPTLVYVNNHYAGHAPATLERLRSQFLQLAEGKGNRHGPGAGRREGPEG